MKACRMLVDGACVSSATGEVIASTDPHRRRPWADVPVAAHADVIAAIAAARRALPDWRARSGSDRAAVLDELAEVVDAHVDDLASTESRDNGKPIREARAQVRFTVAIYRYYAGLARDLTSRVVDVGPGLADETVPEPHGVVALVTPWNSPLQILANKLAPALAAGNTVVVKPSELASVSTLELAGLLRGLVPAGVVNVVTGGPQVGSWLVEEAGVDLISLTGGTETGRAVARQGAERLVPVLLELGGKSANIVLEDADLAAAAAGVVHGIFSGSGQSCVAGSRLLVHRDVHDDLLDLVVTAASRLRLGDPAAPETDIGPLANEAHHARVLAHIAAAVEAGLPLILDGRRGRSGLFVGPTIFRDVPQESRLFQEEVFGPVLAVSRFGDDDEAIELANATRYGLAAGVWSADLPRAQRMARRLDAGTVWINTYKQAAPGAPFGGVKDSGRARERGIEGLQEFVRVKNLMTRL